MLWVLIRIASPNLCCGCSLQLPHAILMSTHNIGFYEDYKNLFCGCLLELHEAIVMSTHNIGFYEDLTKKYLSIILKYHQIPFLFFCVIFYQLFVHM